MSVVSREGEAPAEPYANEVQQELHSPAGALPVI